MTMQSMATRAEAEIMLYGGKLTGHRVTVEFRVGSRTEAIALYTFLRDQMSAGHIDFKFGGNQHSEGTSIEGAPDQPVTSERSL
jgi:hypothetical protein